MTYSEKMLAAIENQDMAEAQLMLEKAIQFDDQDILAELSEQLLRMGFIDDAKRILEETRNLAGEDAAAHLALAEIAIENNEIETAFEHLEQVTTADPEYPESLIIMADLYQLLGIPEVSEAKLKEAKHILPDEPVIDFALAELYFSNEQYGQAILAYQGLQQQGIEEFSGVSFNERIGSAYSMMGGFEEAVAYLEKAVAEESTDDRLFQLAFTYIQLGDNQKAILYLEELRALNPQYQSLYYYLGEALKEDEQLNEAYDVLEEGLQENPYQVELYHLASEVAYRLHDTNKAKELLQQALELPEKNDETRLSLSSIYLREAEPEKALELLAAVDEQDNPYVQWNLAQAYALLEEFTAARAAYEQAYTGLEHEPDFLKEYALFLREDGNPELAQKLLEHYVHHEPGDMEAQSILEDLMER